MEKERIRSFLMLLPLMIVVTAFFGSLYVQFFVSESAFPSEIMFMVRICDGLSTLALISSGIYIASGFKKSSAKFFRLFLYLYAVSHLSLILSLTMDIMFSMKNEVIISSFQIVYFIFNLFILILLSVFLVKENLGKKLSMIMSYLILLINIVQFIASLVSSIPFELIIRNYSGFALSLVLVAMEYLKYYDKKERNTK